MVSVGELPAASSISSNNVIVINATLGCMQQLCNNDSSNTKVQFYVRHDKSKRQHGNQILEQINHTEVPLRRSVHIEEIIIVIIVVAFWLVAFMAFLKKWDSIRIMQPIEPRYKHSPKNLENIKIVKRPQDSIIYKNYSRKMSTTMVAREKRRLLRMHTVPCMGTLSAFPLPLLPTIHTEEVTTEM